MFDNDKIQNKTTQIIWHDLNNKIWLIFQSVYKTCIIHLITRTAKFIKKCLHSTTIAINKVFLSSSVYKTRLPLLKWKQDISISKPRQSGARRINLLRATREQGLLKAAGGRLAKSSRAAWARLASLPEYIIMYVTSQIKWQMKVIIECVYVGAWLAGRV